MSNLRMSRATPLALASALAATLACAPAAAEDFGDRFTFQGYGYQNYLQASKNTYLGADTQGTWDSNFVGLVVAATLTEKSKLWAQFQGSGDDGTRFTWFFVDYQLSDNLRGHVGRVKLPLGFYNEIVDVRSLQLSALTPSLYQEGADMVHDAYHGVGLDYEQDIGAGHVLWQAWGGNTYDVEPPTDSRDRRAFGGRVTWRTPADGLKFMLSAYRTRVQLLADGSLTNEDRAIAGIEYARGNLDLKAEYAHHKASLHSSGGDVKSNAYYVQAGYTVADKWTPYARYDYVTTDKSQRDDPSYYQKTAVLGLGYKVSPNITFKLEGHAIHGYGLAVATGEVTPGAGSNRWNMAVAALDFSF